MIAVLLLVLAGCSSDAIIDLTIEPPPAALIDSVEIVVCSARDRTEVIDTVTLSASSSSVLTLPADGAAVALAATALGGLCGATCQIVLGPDANVTETLFLHPCNPCPTLDTTTANVCANPLCFLGDRALLSACPE